jgi:hypothetical protein
MDTDRPADDVLSGVDRLLERFDGYEPFVHSSLDDPAGTYAAAALARGAALVRAALTLCRSAEHEAVGLLARAAWECWVTGAYLATGGRKAFIRLEAAQLRQESNVAALNGLEADTLRARTEQLHAAERLRLIAEEGRDRSDGSPVSIPRITVQQMAREVGPLIESVTGEPADLLVAYDLFYRAHSAWDVHGLKAIDLHTEISDDGRMIRLRDSIPWLEPHKAIAVAVSYLSNLAWLVEDHFGIDHTELSSLQEQLLDAMSRNAADDVDDNGKPLSGSPQGA